MQKKIIALAVAAVVSAPAFAEVTPYGIVDGAIASASATGQKSDLLALSGGASTSRFGVKATEDLGSGLTAIGVLEYGLDTETNSTVGNTAAGLSARQQMLALNGDFGTVATGYLQTAGYDFAVKYDPLSGSSASPLQSVTGGNRTTATTFLIGSNAGAARAQRALAYISPDFGGFSFAVNYAMDIASSGSLGNLTLADTAADAKVTAALASVNYAAGPLAVSAVYAGVNKPATPNSNEIAVGGSYDFGAAKLMATHQRNTAGTATADAVTNTASSLTGVMPVGADAVAVSYAMNSMNKRANTKEISARGYTVGYLHAFSKNTTVYAAYSAMTQDEGTSAYSVDNNVLAGSTATGWIKGGGSSSLIAVGLRKKF